MEGLIVDDAFGAGGVGQGALTPQPARGLSMCLFLKCSLLVLELPDALGHDVLDDKA